MHLKNGIYIFKLSVKGGEHDKNTNAKIEKLVRVWRATPRLNPLIAPFHVVPAAERYPIKAQPQRRRRITQMQRTKQRWTERVHFQHHFRVSRQYEICRRIEWRTHFTVLGAMHACEDQNATLITSGVAAEHDHLIDEVSVECAFFGEYDQTATPVLILPEHQCRWTKALLVQSKGGQGVCCPTNRTVETRIYVGLPSNLDLKSKEVDELGVSHEVS